MLAILKREFKAYFKSPLAYVFITGFFTLTGVFFMLIEFSPGGGSGRFNIILNNMKLILLFMIPALTMKLISEDKKTKVDILYFTAPIRTYSIILGKFLAATGVFLVTIILSFVYPAILFKFAHPSFAEILNSYIGYFLLGTAFIAICIFASSLTDNQVVAFIIGFSMILSLWILGFLQGILGNQILSEIIGWLSLLKRYDEMAGGILKLSLIVYYISVIILFLFLTFRVTEKRRWNEG